ncbi:MAG: FtsX-like permease family protein [Kiritimatiellae bacterium]|nr:FtsX-like permease family protein [Kiritimatiellia bacterium]
MQKLRIRKQVRLGFARTFEICLNGIYYRLFRSFITVAIIAIAVAFMMYMLSASTIGHAVHGRARAEARDYRVFSRWLSWISDPLSRRDLFRLAAESAPGDARLGSVAGWGALSEPQASALLATARQSTPYLRFLAELSPGRRYRLVGNVEDKDVFDWLLDETCFAQFEERLAAMTAVRPPGDLARLRRLLEAYRGHIPLWQRVAEGRDAALAALRNRFPGLSAGALLAAPPAGFVDALRELGFTKTALDIGSLSRQAAESQRLTALTEILRQPGIKRDIAKRIGVKPLLVDMEDLSQLCRAARGARFFEQSLARHGLTAPMNGDELQAFFTRHLARTQVLRIEAESAGFAEGAGRFSPRTVWLIVVSCVVCVVGIANAMLMSVMERFREIATMKCLGATDAFVMTLFVLESCLLGVIGGLAGALLGLLLALPSALFKFGSFVWQVLSVHDVLTTGGVALLTGIVLAGVASVYPAYVAARLVPMEAMRVE